MKLKSLILGSATAALAATGAQAADAIIIAEPEPVEYVRVCDVYGAGFFYIPGTETCLRIGGEIRYQLGTAASDDFGATSNFYGFHDDTWNSHSRLRLYFDARSETELGQLRGYVRIDSARTNSLSGVTATAGPTADGTYLNHGWLSLGGFRAGWTDSAWVHTPQGGAVSYNTHSDDQFFTGYQQRHLIQYNFSGSNGFLATISLEDDNRAGTDYMPDVVGVVGVNQGWGAAWLKVGFDESYNAFDDSGWSATAGVRLNVPGAPGSSLLINGYYSDSDNAYGAFAGTNFRNWVGSPEFALKASYQHQFNAQFSASLGVHYFNDFYVRGTDVSTGNDGWAVEATVVWSPVKDFVVRGEVIYTDLEGFGNGIDRSDDAISGYVRFSRFF